MVGPAVTGTGPGTSSTTGSSTTRPSVWRQTKRPRGLHAVDHVRDLAGLQRVGEHGHQQRQAPDSRTPGGRRPWVRTRVSGPTAVSTLPMRSTRRAL
jgi:hypothetical protein